MTTGKEIELIAFDYLRGNPHYHYGPGNQKERIFMDTPLLDDSLEGVLDQFKSGRLRSMIERSSYPDIPANVGAGLLAKNVVELESTKKDRAKAFPR